MRLLQKHQTSLTVLLVVLLAGWLYWPTVRLPLIYDTLLHIRITGGLDFGSVWLPTEAFGFYRPMTFFPMLVFQKLFDGYPPWLLHGNNVLQHAANAGLLGLLSWRLWQDWRRAIAAGAIFATFPFAYQAVTVYGHNVHPAIVGLVLLGLHGYLTAVSHHVKGTRRGAEGARSYAENSRVNRWWVVTVGLFVVMLLTHETAVLFGGFALLVQLNAQPKLLKQPRLLLRQPWLWFLVAGVAYLILYQFFPISRAPQVESGENSYWLNGLYLLQAAVFPLAWFAHILPAISGATVVVVSGGLALAVSVWLVWRRPAWRLPLLLAWGWWAAASALIGVALSTEYLLRGPRLLYLGGVGVALLWAHLLAGLWDGAEQSNQRLRGLGWTAVLAFILITSGQFVQKKLTQYEQLTEPVRVWQNSEIVPVDAEVVFINLPQWLDVSPSTYAVGVEFVSMLGGYLFVDELTSANGLGSRPVWAVELPELRSQIEYAYGIHAQHSWPPLTNESRLLFITEFAEGQPKTRLTGLLTQLPMPDEGFYVNAQFEMYQLEIGDPRIFVRYRVAEVCDGVVNVRLIWRARHSAIPDTTSVFVQVLDADGRLLAQADGPPLGIRPSLLAAPPETTLFDFREIELAEGETAVPTTLLVGVYDFASGERSPATDDLGQPLPDNAWRWPITNCPTTQ